MLSNAPPEIRLATHFEKPDLGWVCSTHAVPKPATAIAGAGAALGTAEAGGSKNYYLYVMSKADETPE